MIFQLILLISIIKFLKAAELATYKGLMDLECSYVCVPKSTNIVINGNTSRPSSCNEVVGNGQSKVIVTLESGLEVMCDLETDGGGWLVIQRRINGKLNFYRGWEDYKKGFGDYVNGEFYLGNEHIHTLTTNGTYELRIDFEYARGKYSAYYSRFYLFGESDGYMLHISGFAGNAGDSFGVHNGMRFTTYDKDLDTEASSNCALTCQGAWWYLNCQHVNLNGLWDSKEVYKGMNWLAITGHHLSVSSSEMKIRRII